MKVEMTLTVNVTGTNLVEIQNGLIAAALQTVAPETVTANTAQESVPRTSGYLKREDVPPAPVVKVPPQGEPAQNDDELEAAAIRRETAQVLRKQKVKKEKEEKTTAPATSVAVVSEQTTEVAVVAEGGGGTPTRADVMAAISAVNELVSFDAAKAILTEFKYARASEIPSEKMAEVIAACRSKIAEAQA